MTRTHITKHSPFYCIGLSYEKANATIRGKFSLSEEAHKCVLEQAMAEGIGDIIAISTCNRTEIYGFGEHPFQLIKPLCDNTRGTVDEFQQVCYIHKNNEAISHMFRVGAGLESQILGDFEIIGQLKQSFAVSKQLSLVNSFMERLVNSVIQASKRIKTETDISSGATSVAYASVQYILSRTDNIKDKNILLYGTGLIGRNTCKNLISHVDKKQITLINRSKDSAEEFAAELGVTAKDFSDLKSEIAATDILIVATGAANPTITENIVGAHKGLLILDMSLPKNVASAVAGLDGVRVVHLDELSQITDATIAKRTAQVPRAEAIIKEIETDFNTWVESRKIAPTIHAIKTKLSDMSARDINAMRNKIPDFNEAQATAVSDRMIQRATNRFARHLKDNTDSQAEAIALISQIFQLDDNS